MTAFLSIAALLTLLVIGRLLWPLLRGARGSTLTVAQLNSKVYRDQLQELERDLARGQLTEPAYAEARDELQRRLLEDVSAAPARTAVPSSTSGRWTAVALAVLVPLGAAGLYNRVGNAAAIDAPTARAGTAPEDVLRAVEHLAEALRKSPDNLEGWVLLGRAYARMERFADAAAAYERAAPLIQKDAGLLVEQADVLAAAAGDQLEGRPMDLVKQALALNPKHPMGLMLMGMSAYRRGDHAGAVAEWDKLMAVLPPDSPEARQVQSNIDQARSEGKLPAPTAAPPVAAATGATVSGEVTVAPALAAQLKPDDVLFVIARPDDGSRAPVAVLRKRVADLPLTFTLDDSMAMMPERTVSKAKSVVLVARISRSGQPMQQPGDLASEPSEAVAPGTKGVRLVIDRQL
jgi:cytochrome c-type biogenesis protein CcmH